jgi:hypothetical protein
MIPRKKVQQGLWVQVVQYTSEQGTLAPCHHQIYHEPLIYHG